MGIAIVSPVPFGGFQCAIGWEVAWSPGICTSFKGLQFNVKRDL